LLRCRYGFFGPTQEHSALRSPETHFDACAAALPRYGSAPAGPLRDRSLAWPRVTNYSRKSHGDAATENVGVNSKHERDRRYENGTVGENQNSTSKFPSLRTTSTLPTRVPGGQRTHRCLVPGRILFDSMASAAESLRSTCGSERRPPECNKQRWPEATPHVGQGTEDNCSGVRSRILIVIECDKKRRNSVQFGTVLKISPRKLSILPAGCREQGSRTLPG
jgi:hypothetical protein